MGRVYGLPGEPGVRSGAGVRFFDHRGERVHLALFRVAFDQAAEHVGRSAVVPDRARLVHQRQRGERGAANQEAPEGHRQAAREPACTPTTFWLVERTTVSPPQYVSLNSAGWHHDVWMARRFGNEREAHDYWRMMGERDRQEFMVIEHLFVNKQ